MITYEPKPFLDAAPVNALIHKRPWIAYQLTLRENMCSFKAGGAVRDFAKLSCPHKYNSLVTHSAINALQCNDVYIVHGFTPVAEADNVFSYSPTDSMAGGVSYVDGGISCGWGVSSVGGGIPCWWPGVSISPSVFLRIILTAGLHNTYYHTLPYNVLLKQCNVAGVSYRYTRQPVQQSATVEQSPVIDNAIIVESRRMSPFAKASKAIKSGALVYVEVDNEFVAIGKIH